VTRQRAKLAMQLFLLSETVFFFLLLLAFVYFRDSSRTVAAGNLNLPVTAFYTVCLAVSSFSMWRAARHPAGARAWLGITIALGAVFLLGQGAEWLRLFRRGVTISQDLFGATFFTLTGLHALHALIGIGLLAIVLSLAAGLRRSLAIQTLALYWYFTGIVWIAIFAIVYLWTFL
jgi:heme/copper-type cytochrome/quinol oxidase subunit 3